MNGRFTSYLNYLSKENGRAAMLRGYKCSGLNFSNLKRSKMLFISHMSKEKPGIHTHRIWNHRRYAQNTIMHNNFIFLPAGCCFKVCCLCNVLSSLHIKWEDSQIWCRYLHITSVCSLVYSMINQCATTAIKMTCHATQTLYFKENVLKIMH